MDFHSLARRDLQTLCKRNKIPANMTNVAMADALSNLIKVEGIEDIGNPAAVPESPLTCRKTTTRKAPRKDVGIETEPESCIALTHTRRSTRKIKLEEQEKKDPTDLIEKMSGLDISQTPVPRTGRKRATAAFSVKKIETMDVKEEEKPVVGMVYSTRRSRRLMSEKKALEFVPKGGRRTEAIKISALSEEEPELKKKKSLFKVKEEIKENEGTNVVKQEVLIADQEDEVSGYVFSTDASSEVKDSVMALVPEQSKPEEFLDVEEGHESDVEDSNAGKEVDSKDDFPIKKDSIADQYNPVSEDISSTEALSDVKEIIPALVNELSPVEEGDDDCNDEDLNAGPEVLVSKYESPVTDDPIVDQEDMVSEYVSCTVASSVDVTVSNDEDLNAGPEVLVSKYESPVTDDPIVDQEDMVSEYVSCTVASSVDVTVSIMGSVSEQSKPEDFLNPNGDNESDILISNDKIPVEEDLIASQEDSSTEASKVSANIMGLVSEQSNGDNESDVEGLNAYQPEDRVYQMDLLEGVMKKFNQIAEPISDQLKMTPLNSANKKPLVGTPKTIIKVLDECVENTNNVSLSLNTNCKQTMEVAEEKENVGENRLVSNEISLRQLRKMFKSKAKIAGDSKNNDTKKEKQIEMRRPALQVLNKNCLVPEKV